MSFWTLCHLGPAHLCRLISDHSFHCPHSSSLRPLTSLLLSVRGLLHMLVLLPVTISAHLRSSPLTLTHLSNINSHITSSKRPSYSPKSQIGAPLMCSHRIQNFPFQSPNHSSTQLPVTSAVFPLVHKPHQGRDLICLVHGCISCIWLIAMLNKHLLNEKNYCCPQFLRGMKQGLPDAKRHFPFSNYPFPDPAPSSKMSQISKS